MKNFFKSFAIAAALLLCRVSVFAQAGAGFDYFEVPRAVAVIPATNVLNGGVQNVTNFIDRIGYAGIAKLSVFFGTNSGNATNGCVIASSPDQTNWTSVPYATNTAYLQLYTNTYYGSTTVTGTNIFLLPGLPTTPNIAIAGFGTPYLAPAPYTNSGYFGIGSNGWYDVGFNISDCNRYIRVIFTSYSNVTYGAELTARKVY